MYARGTEEGVKGYARFLSRTATEWSVGDGFGAPLLPSSGDVRRHDQSLLPRSDSSTRHTLNPFRAESFLLDTGTPGKSKFCVLLLVIVGRMLDRRLRSEVQTSNKQSSSSSSSPPHPPHSPPPFNLISTSCRHTPRFGTPSPRPAPCEGGPPRPTLPAPSSPPTSPRPVEPHFGTSIT